MAYKVKNNWSCNSCIIVTSRKDFCKVVLKPCPLAVSHNLNEFDTENQRVLLLPRTTNWKYLVYGHLTSPSYVWRHWNILYRFSRASSIRQQVQRSTWFINPLQGLLLHVWLKPPYGNSSNWPIESCLVYWPLLKAFICLAWLHGSNACDSTASLTLGAHAPEGYSSCLALWIFILSFCLSVCLSSG